MASQVFNFGAGPAMLPRPVMKRIQEEFLNFKDMGVGLIEISHRSKQFEAVLERAKALFRELSGVPENYKILFVHGGARMQFSAIPLNLLARKSSRRAFYYESGNFAKLAFKDAQRYGDVRVLSSSAAGNYDRIPEFNLDQLDPEASYVHLTSNNTIYGTRWNNFPDTGEVPLITDQTSEILSRQMDYSRFGMVYAGMQKNLGPSGMAMVVIREDLLGHAVPHTPVLLDYSVIAKDNSLTNTTNTFAIYVTMLVLEWLKEQGGVAAIEARNNEKAQLLYSLLDRTPFYGCVAQPAHRSMMNVTFTLPSEELTEKFLKEAGAEGLYALKGHRNVGGVRASIYNPMPVEGVEVLASFMEEFERKNG